MTPPILLYCKSCQCIFSLSKDMKQCDCGNSKGFQISKREAKYWGNAVPMVIASRDFKGNIESQPESGDGKANTIFVISKKNINIVKQD